MIIGDGKLEVMMNGRYIQELSREGNISIKEINEEIIVRKEFIEVLMGIKKRKKISSQKFFEIVQKYYILTSPLRYR